MKSFFFDYGMLVVLVALCVGFSIATWEKQHPTGATAAQEVAARIISEFKSESTVYIVVGADLQFALSLTELLKKDNWPPAHKVDGNAVDFRDELTQLKYFGKTETLKPVSGTLVGLAAPNAGAGPLAVTSTFFPRKFKIDVVGSTSSTSAWNVFYLDEFPEIRRAAIIRPRSYYWPRFLNVDNLINIANQIAVIAIIAIGMTMVIITGGIDLSVGSLIALAAMVSAWLIMMAGSAVPYVPTVDFVAIIWVFLLSIAGGSALVLYFFLRVGILRAVATITLGGAVLLLLYALSPFVIAPLVVLFRIIGPNPIAVGACFLIAVFVCGGIGFFSGSMVTFYRVPPFIVTLAMMMVARGMARKIQNGGEISQVPASFGWLGGAIWPKDFPVPAALEWLVSALWLTKIPLAVVLMFALYVIAHILMTHTSLGRYIYAVGGNAEAARLSGVPVKAVLLFVYSLSGALAGLGGLIWASRLNTGSPNYGETHELNVIAAAVVGGASLAGGEGKIFSTLIGAFIIAVMANGMNLKGIGEFDQQVILGLVILAAVLFDMVKRGTAAQT